MVDLTHQKTPPRRGIQNIPPNDAMGRLNINGRCSGRFSASTTDGKPEEMDQARRNS